MLGNLLQGDIAVDAGLQGEPEYKKGRRGFWRVRRSLGMFWLIPNSGIEDMSSWLIKTPAKLRKMVRWKKCNLPVLQMKKQRSECELLTCFVFRDRDRSQTCAVLGH